MIKACVLIILLVVLAWCLGVRVHPDAMFPAKEESFVRVTLNTGEAVSGNLVSENEQQIEINMEGALVPFSRTEISNIEAIKHTENKPLVTYSPENSLFNFGKPTQTKTVQKSASKKSKSSGGLFGGFDITSNIQTGLTARNQVEHMKNTLNRKTEETQNIK